ncbi:substrate-binding domain-containing protein [Lichenifustis flavocetrariae]|uniref:Substrate-binding domain-containing protein n=1 Tax=Lichenifustis flavocetrariae TaxID=2949735 RepID=A0AA41Z531_9HYPH|nr:substrate-binding domain-containing protein [Lichenifustis flavocetrariae]MCW6510628.1 substrate-binding domain-containing protein [Lichenifustis flavocetrariae]
MKHSLMVSTTLLALASGAAHADALVDEAKAVVTKATARVDKWEGPTAGPKSVGKKLVVYVAGDMRNGGILGVAKGVKEAADVIGWTYREIDGQGSVSGQATALSQAVALKPDAIIVGGSDAVEQKAALEEAASHGIAIVGWHSGPKPGPLDGTPVFANVTTDAMEVARVASMKAIADSDGKAGVVIYADSTYAIAIAKGRAMEAEIKKCAGCKVVAFEDTPLADVSTRIPQLTTTLLQQNGSKWGYSLAINDLYYDFMPPSLEAAGIAGEGNPQNISAGDGSESAYQRIRAKDHQAATVPEPLNMQGWQLVDELNRDFAKQPWSGFVPSVHLVTADNIAFDGGPKNVFDPDNGYRDHYKAIWGAK